GSICDWFGRVLEVVGEHADGGVAVEDLLHACPPVVDGRWTALTGLSARADAPLPVAVDDQFVSLSLQVTAPQGRNFGVRQARGNQSQDEGVPAPEEPMWPAAQKSFSSNSPPSSAMPLRRRPTATSSGRRS
ncbi:MAG TPA: hypothetical protein VF926_01045, partial [Mycobacterium sp.]